MRESCLRCALPLALFTLLICLLCSCKAKPEPGELIGAARDNDEARVALLLRSGADVNESDESGGTALHWAVYNNNNPLARLLIDADALIDASDDKDMTPLMIALHENYLELAELLLESGAAVGPVKGHTTPLHYAALWNKPQACELLIKHGADIEAKSEMGRTPLTIARINGSTDAADMLIKLGARN